MRVKGRKKDKGMRIFGEKSNIRFFFFFLIRTTTVYRTEV
jgi:hypothetical protein